MRDSSESTPNIFLPHFLERISELPRSGAPSTFEASHAGPWSVVKVSEGFALHQDGSLSVAAVFTHHETAHLVAAILPAIGRTSPYMARPQADRSRVQLHLVRGNLNEEVGWMRTYSDELLEALHVAESLLRSPASLALFLQAASFESLEPAGGIAASRILLRSDD